MRVARAISPLLAVLIIFGITMAVGLTVALISGSMVQRLQPSGASLTIQSIRAQKVTKDGKTIFVDAVITVNGPESVKITRAILYINGHSIGTTSFTSSTAVFISPGTTITLHIVFRVGQSFPDYTPVRLILMFQDAVGNTYETTASGVLEPYTV